MRHEFRSHKNLFTENTCYPAFHQTTCTNFWAKSGKNVLSNNWNKHMLDVECGKVTSQYANNGDSLFSCVYFYFFLQTVFIKIFSTSHTDSIISFRTIVIFRPKRRKKMNPVQRPLIHNIRSCMKNRVQWANRRHLSTHDKFNNRKFELEIDDNYGSYRVCPIQDGMKEKYGKKYIMWNFPKHCFSINMKLDALKIIIILFLCSGCCCCYSILE